MTALRTTTRIQGGFRRGPAISIVVDGSRIEAFAGETVAAALIAAGRFATRQSPTGMARGPYCLMGSCQECAILVAGRKQLACATEAVDGLVVQLDRAEP